MSRVVKTALAAAVLACAAAPAHAQNIFEVLFGQPMRQASLQQYPQYQQQYPRYQQYQQEERTSAGIPREMVAYQGPYSPGTIVINTSERRLYLVQPGGKAIKYGIGVGRPGFEWRGAKTVTAKQEWPDWRPPEEMLRRRPDLPRYMAGGPDNPLGARALYLGSSLYRIHGSNEPETIGHAVSSGCFRMLNDDVVDLYERVRVGAQVVVL